MTLNVLSLFAGIGGLRPLELGLERAGMTTVGQVEIDPFCRRVLAKHWPEVPRHDDVRTAVDWWLGEPRPTVDVICGGFPCQDISNAGLREGIEGERSGLWIHLRDTVRDLRPRYVVLENVAAILVRGLDVVAGDLAAIGYDLEWDCVPAASVGAPHQRDRWWGIAYPQPRPVADATGDRRRQGRSRGPTGRGADRKGQWPEVLAHADGGRLVRRAGIGRPGRWPQPADCGWWAAEPDVGRVAHGVPARVDRLRALGNAVVPAVAEHIGRLIVEAETRAAA